MAGTNWARYVLGELQERFPKLRAGICNCRKIARTDIWSQHSDCNALDLYHADYGYSLDPAHQAFLDEVNAFILAHFDELSIRTRLWRKKDHFNHIHIDGWPKRYGLPSCAGATTSKWQYPNGDVVTLAKYASPDPLNGYNELPDAEIPEVTTVNIIQRGDSGFEVALHQEALIQLGYDLGNWPPYDGPVPAWFKGRFSVGADGAAGAAFEQGVTKFQEDASLTVTGKVDGVTSSLLLNSSTPSHVHVFDGTTGVPA